MTPEDAAVVYFRWGNLGARDGADLLHKAPTQGQLYDATYQLLRSGHVGETTACEARKAMEDFWGMDCSWLQTPKGNQ